MGASSDSYYGCFKLRIKEVYNWLTGALQVAHLGTNTTRLPGSFDGYFQPDKPQGDRN